MTIKKSHLVAYLVYFILSALIFNFLSITFNFLLVSILLIVIPHIIDYLFNEDDYSYFWDDDGLAPGHLIRSIGSLLIIALLVFIPTSIEKQTKETNNKYKPKELISKTYFKNNIKDKNFEHTLFSKYKLTGDSLDIFEFTVNKTDSIIYNTLKVYKLNGEDKVFIQSYTETIHPNKLKSKYSENDIKKIVLKEVKESRNCFVYLILFFNLVMFFNLASFIDPDDVKNGNSKLQALLILLFSALILIINIGIGSLLFIALYIGLSKMYTKTNNIFIFWISILFFILIILI